MDAPLEREAPPTVAAPSAGPFGPSAHQPAAHQQATHQPAGHAGHRSPAHLRLVTDDDDLAVDGFAPMPTPDARPVAASRVIIDRADGPHGRADRDDARAVPPLPRRRPAAPPADEAPVRRPVRRVGEAPVRADRDVVARERAAHADRIAQLLEGPGQAADPFADLTAGHDAVDADRDASDAGDRPVRPFGAVGAAERIRRTIAALDAARDEPRPPLVDAEPVEDLEPEASRWPLPVLRGEAIDDTDDLVDELAAGLLSARFDGPAIDPADGPDGSIFGATGSALVPLHDDDFVADGAGSGLVLSRAFHDPGRSFDEHLAKVGAENIWVAEVEGGVVGLAGLIPDVPELEPVVVSGAHRGQGIGRLLAETVISAAREGGARTIQVRPVGRNVEAIRFFHELGFDILYQLELGMDLVDRERAIWVSGERLADRDFRF